MSQIEKNGPSRIIFNIVNAVILSLIALVCLYPFIYIAASSISDPIAISQGKVVFLPIGFDLTAYKLVLNYPMIGRSYLNTLIYTGSYTILGLLLTVTGAYCLSRKSLYGRKLFNLLIVISMIFPAGIIPNFLLVNNTLNLKNTIWAIILPNAIQTFYLIVMRTFIEEIPAALEESAKIDGANHMQILMKIIIPLSKTSLLTIGLFYAISEWNSWFPALVYLGDEKKFPIQILLRNIVISQQTSDMVTSAEQDAAAISESIKYAVIMVATLPILFVYPFVQKYFVQGVMIGSVKG